MLHYNQDLPFFLYLLLLLQKVCENAKLSCVSIVLIIEAHLLYTQLCVCVLLCVISLQYAFLNILHILRVHFVFIAVQ